MRVLAATVQERLAPWPGARGLRLTAPAVGRVAPGQFLLLSAVTRALAVLPMVAYPLAQSSGVLDALLPTHAGPAWTDGDLPLDRAVRILGPAGRAFAIESRTRRALLVGGGAGLGPLLFLTHQMIERGIEVTFVGAPDESGLALPPSILPPEVEYVLPKDSNAEIASGALLNAVEAALPWADALYVALPQAALPPIVNLMRRQLLRLRRGFAQALLDASALPCGVGACDLCVISTREGYRRPCRDGLVFDLLSLS